MEEMFALQYYAIVVMGGHETDFAILVFNFYFTFLSQVDEQHCGEYFGEELLECIDSSEEGVGDSYEYEIETAEVEDEGVEED